MELYKYIGLPRYSYCDSIVTILKDIGEDEKQMKLYSEVFKNVREYTVRNTELILLKTKEV